MIKGEEFSMNDLTISQKLGQLGAGLNYEDIPQDIQTNAKKFILDVIGVILGAKAVLSSSTMIDTIIHDLGGQPDSTIMGYGVKVSPNLAALANGTMGHAFDMDDDHREGIQHPTIVVFPAFSRPTCKRSYI